MIIVETNAGLANRMRTVASAVCMAREYHHEVRVIWPMNSLLNCAFDRLFQPIEGTEVKNTGFPAYYLHPAILQARYRHSFISVDRTNNRDLIACMKRGDNVYVNTNAQFYEIDHYSCFQAVTEIREAAEGIAGPYLPDLIGVHIRRTDNIRSIENSPTEMFERAILSELERNPAVHFFLATDSAEEEKRIVSRFGESIVLNPNRSADRRTESGVAAALTDMVCLSLCPRIYGSYFSSFDKTAAEWGGKELIVMKKQNS